MMSRFLSLFLLALLFGGFGLAVYHALRAQADAGKGMPAYSVYSAEKDGLAEAAGLLRKLGWHPVAVTRPIHHTHDRGLLVVVEPQAAEELIDLAPPVSEADARALVHWVEEGNTLLLCGRHPNAIHDELGIELTGDSQTAPAPVVLGEAGGYTDGIKNLVVEGRDAIRAEQGLPLWWVDNDPGAMLLRRGKGWVLVVADPSLLTLRGMRRADNVRFLYNVATLNATDGRVYFDEYHHGLRSGGGFWGYLRYYGRQWMLLQVLVVALVAAWAVAVRLGPAVPRPVEKRADAVDYASAVARIYQRAGARTLLARVLVRDFMDWLSHYLRIRRPALPAEILAAWRRHHAAEPEGGQGKHLPVAESGPAHLTGRLQKLLRGVAQLRKGAVSERQLLAWAQAFDQFKAEVLREP